MRRILIMLLALVLVFPCAAAAAEKPRYIALTFDGGSPEELTRLLEGLRERELTATFFLDAGLAEADPGLAARIAGDGHELGLQGRSSRENAPMSRREIAAELDLIRGMLPQRCSVRLLRLRGSCSDALRQVARVTGLSIAGWSVESGSTVPRDGDVLALHEPAPGQALELIDRLRRAGFTLVTMSELARLREVRLKPGETYRRFPGEPG